MTVDPADIAHNRAKRRGFLRRAIVAGAAGVSMGLLAKVTEKPQVAEATHQGVLQLAHGNFHSGSTYIWKTTTGGIGFEAYGAQSGSWGAYSYGNVLGHFGTGGTYGVYGAGRNSGAYGVVGTGTTGVYGSGGSFGVYGTGGTIGVYGTGTGRGISGYSASGYAVTGETNNGWAGVFFGDIYVRNRIVFGSGRVLSDAGAMDAQQSSAVETNNLPKPSKVPTPPTVTVDPPPVPTPPQQ